VNKSFPAGEDAASAQAVESGSFYGVMHPSTGTATIYRLGDGHRILRFTNFRTSNGPDVHVYLVAANEAKDSATVKRADLDLSKYRTISIWCKRFAVNFGAAPLRAGPMISQN
jgi:hypothetical protein